MAYQPSTWDEYYDALGTFAEPLRLRFDARRRDAMLQSALSGDPRQIVNAALWEEVNSPPVISQSGSTGKNAEGDKVDVTYAPMEESSADFAATHTSHWYGPNARRTQADDYRYQAMLRAEQEKRKARMIGSSVGAAVSRAF